MIRRFFTLQLVFMMLVNQGLCLAHVHHGNDVEAPGDHGSRPHIHVGGHVHHDHGHNHHDADHSHSYSDPESDEHDAAIPPTFSPVDYHDSNAVYLAETVTTARKGGNSVSVLPEKDVGVAAILLVTNQNDRLRHWGPIRGQPPSVFDGASPIYLRTLSLRI